MNKIALFSTLFLSSICSRTFAQIPNGDFEVSDYYWQFLQGQGSTASAQRSSTTSWYAAGTYTNTTGESHATFEITNPAQSTYTQATSLVSNNGVATAGIQVFAFAYFHNTTNSYDSMTYIPSAGTISGTVSVYAYNV